MKIPENFKVEILVDQAETSPYWHEWLEDVHPHSLIAQSISLMTHQGIRKLNIIAEFGANIRIERI